jgi:hypothetical protein
LQTAVPALGVRPLLPKLFARLAANRPAFK